MKLIVSAVHAEYVLHIFLGNKLCYIDYNNYESNL